MGNGAFRDKFAAAILLAATGLASTAAAAPRRSAAQLRALYRKQPLRFEANRGEAGAGAQFVSHGPGYELALSSSEATLALQHASVRMRLAGSNAATAPAGLDEAPGKVNYYIGNDPPMWREGISTFAKVQYRDIYPGVDLVYYGSQGGFEYDFTVAPGVDPRAIGLVIDGARTRIDRKGNLILKVTGGEIQFHKPEVYQQDPERTPVKGRYLLRGNRVSFELAAYDRSKPLVIDPVVTYSTYLGGTLDFFGNGAETDGFGIAVDPSGNIYVAGSTNAIQAFPVVNAHQSTAPTPDYLVCPAGTVGNAFVAKLSSTGTPIYVTYLGGTRCNQGLAVAADSSGDASVTGWTESSDFPVTPGAFQTSKPSAGTAQAAFLTKFNSTGGLAYSTYIASGQPGSVAVDGGGNVYLTGETDTTFSSKTTTGAYRTTCASTDTYVIKFSSTNTLQYASCLASKSGGSGIALDPSGNIYVLGGVTSSTDFVVKNGFQASVAGRRSAFLAKLKPAGSGTADLLYSTIFGGSGDDEATAIAADSVGNAYIVGNTGSADLPVTSPPFKSTCLPQTFACTSFVAKFNTLAAGATSRVFATYLGGSSGDDAAQGVAVDNAGNGYVTGYTASSDFPTVNPIYGCTGCAGGNESMFVTEFSPAGSILFSTFLGGSTTDSDEAFSIALDTFAAIYVTGTAGSQNLPPSLPIPACMNPLQPVLLGFFDAFVVKLSGGAGPALATSTNLISSANPSVWGQQVTFTAAVTNPLVCSANGPTGTVTIKDGATTLGSFILSNGTVAFATSTLSVGNHSITASYGGDANFAPSASAAVNQTVNKAATTTGITASANPVSTGEDELFTATVAIVAPGAGSPTGIVTFSEGNTTFATPPLISNKATFNTSTLGAGNHAIRATYSGDSDFLGSAAAIVVQVVTLSILVNETITVTDTPASQFAIPILVNEAITVTDAPTVGNTPSGSNVVSQPVDTTTGSSPVTLTFSNVTQAGVTSLTTSTNGPPPPTGFQLGSPPAYYNLTTTAGFTGPIQVCINYTGIAFQTPPGPKLYHFESGSWVDRTVSVDTVNMIVCGSVSSLSPFGLFQAATGVVNVSSEVKVTSTGFVFSRVTKTFNGTLTLKNTSTQNIAGPIQIVFTNLTTGVTLANASGTTNGNAFITVPGVVALAPGQSASVNVQFSDASNASINFLSVTYSGSF